MDSIQPVITKCPVSEDNEIDLDELKDQVLRRLMNDLKIKRYEEKISILDRNAQSLYQK